MRLSKFITKKIRLRNWHLTLLKWSSLAFGICLGAVFNELLDEFLLPIFAFAILSGCAVAGIWIRAMKKACQEECEAAQDVY